MFSRCLLILGGAALLLVAIGGLVAWATGFTFLEQGLLDGVPFFFNKGGRQIQVSGRIVGLVAIIVPVLGAVGGIWLLRVAFEREQ